MMNPKTKQPALSPFLLSKPASEHPFYLGKGIENATQLSRCDSIELNGRIDTRGPVLNGPWTQARASSRPFPAPLTTFPLEGDPHQSQGGMRRVTQTAWISRLTQERYL